MRVLVCGGRCWENMKKTFGFLDYLNEMTPITCVIEGNAKGADEFAGEWAKSRNIPLEIYKADWDKYGKSAGAIRNTKMLKEGCPDQVVAFPGGAGTQNMVLQAQKAGLSVLEFVDFDE